MIKEKKIILFLFLAFILTIFLLKIDAYAVNELTNEELVTAKNNGIVSAMCYVQNLMTGAVAKSIMALSVLGVGWLFLLGGASWVTVLTFTVATSLVFGGVELANIISGNNLSCQSILKAEEEFNETVYNKGLCGINKITIYKTGQTWLACVKEDNTKNIDSCPKMIDNNTFIEEKLDTQNQIFRTVVLSKCQEGYLKKDNNIYLEYNCNKDKNGIGYFTDSKNNKENIDKGSCKLACKESSLNSVYRGYNLIPIMDTNEKIKILNGRLENGYYPQDTELQVQCASGFVTYFDEGKDLKETCFGENCKNKNKFSLKCAPNGLFKPNINCKQSCSYDPYKDIDNNVKEWGRYKNNEYKPFDQNNKIFIEGDRVIIKNCKSGYMLAKGEGGLIGECRESLWWWDLGGSKCKITCKKSTLNKSVSFNGDSWFGCDDSKYCKKDISETEEFALGDSIVASGKCEGGYSISGSGENFLKYTCAQNGSWESNGGKSCKLNCKISDTNNGLPGIKNTEEWKLLSSNNKEDIKNGEKVQAVKCKEGYNVYPDNPTIYVCENGKFLYYGGPYEEYCKKGCKFEELKYLSYAGVPNNYDLTNSTKTWVECNESGLPTIRTIEEKDKEGNINYKNVYKTIVSLENTKEANLFARSGSYYRIEECRDGYERVTEKEDDILVAKCSENKNSEKKVEWLITKFDWNACRIAPKCYEFHVDADYSSKEITIGSNKIGSTGYSYYGNSSINVKMQLWGAPGGSNDDVKKNIGGYSKGILLLKPKESNRTLYITVGSSGIPGKTKSGGRNTGLGGFNGGGDGGLAIIEKDNMCQMSNGSGGGGATDIRYGGKLLDNRILVAGGGGGESGWIKENGLIIIGYKGGGEFGDGDESKSPSKNGKGGKQEFSDSTSLLDPIYNSFVTSGVKGFGGHGTIYIKDKNCIAGGGGGGGGYYGGSGGAPGAGGGGSGYFNEKILIETSKDEKPKNLTTIVSTGPQNGGFARVCWGDWYKQNDPCDSNHEESTSYKNNAGFNDNRTKCILNEGKSFKVNNNIEECSNESLKEFMIKENLLIPEILNEKLPKKYYKGMTIRQECGEGYIAKDHKSSGRVTFKCEGNNSWKIDSRGCMKHGCQEFKFVGADEPFEIPDTVEEVKMQVWGGEGGGAEKGRGSGKGGYSYGNMRIDASNKKLFVYVGSRGNKSLYWNNGAGKYGFGAAGGASDIRTIVENLTNNTDSLNSRIIVAGGAGGGGYNPGGAGGGGNGNGGDVIKVNACVGLGGTSNSGGKQSSGSSGTCRGTYGGFGYGGNGCSNGAGGGSGWYGGGGGCCCNYYGGGGGGSGHLSGSIIAGTGGGSSGVKLGDGFARICWGDHPACDDTTGKRNKACEMEEYSCNDTEIPSEYNIIIPTTGTTIPGTSKVFQCKSGYTGSVKFWCGRDKWIYFSGECKIAHGCYEFTATGKGKELDMSNVNFGGESIVKIQLWGARGGGNNPGLGGYSKGNFKLQNNKVLNIFVGGTPKDKTGGFNGGGYAGVGTSIAGYGGGGATDIRYGGKLLGNRILVAGGGGGSSSNNISGGKGGGISGGGAQWDVGGGSQTSGGVIDTKNSNFAITNVFSTIGVLGQGGHGSGFLVKGSGSGAGGGYYGGGGGEGSEGSNVYSAGGGSGYIGGVTEGQTTDASNGPASGGFARICWGNWGEQINPCDSGNSGYTNNAGIGTNKTKCTVNPGVDSGEGGTLPTCSSDTLIAKMNDAHVQIPNNATKNNLPPKYYQGMAIRSTCKSGYSLVSGGLSYGRVELTCEGNGNWTVNGTCAITPTCYEFTATGKGKKLDISAINSNVTEVKIQLWGAPGGNTSGKVSNDNLGGYSKGNFKLQNNKILYVFVGGKGGDGSGANTNNGKGGAGGFNGGGRGGGRNSSDTGYASGGGGGGATDIRINNTAPLTCDSSDPRIIVAGGGGGNVFANNNIMLGGKGGRKSAGDSSSCSSYSKREDCSIGQGGKNDIGGNIDKIAVAVSKLLTNGVKGQGGFGDSYYVDLRYHSGAGGGGGYYGGSGSCNTGGGGGSGYIDGITDGQTELAPKGPNNGGFARICWGDWTGQTNPCDSNYEESTSYTTNAGISTNKTKCIANPNLEDVVGVTLPTCSLDSLITEMNNVNVNTPKNAAANLPSEYYQGMKVRNDCKSGYSLVSEGASEGRVEFTCGSNGTWTVNGTCGVSPTCYEFTATGKGKKLDISAINSNVTEVKIQLWGAKGGGKNPGLGGYSKGNFKLLPDNKALNIFVGGTPKDKTGGFNGGGTGAGSSFGGGGATDVRYGGLTLTNRIIVAGGGGGFSRWSGGQIGMQGGGERGKNTSNSSTWDGIGGGQTFNCVVPTTPTYNINATCGVEGVGGHGSNYGGGGGGGGWYGGSGGAPNGGGGGSGYIGKVTNGETTHASNGPISGGFARICWGDWTGQDNPCDSNYEESTSYTTNAGIGTNKTKCIADATNLQDVVGGTAPSCSLASFNTKMDSENVNKPGGLQNIYYEGMYIRVGCKSGYSLVSGGTGGFRATCGSDGNWTVNGKCSQQCNNNAPLNGYNVLSGTGQTNSGSTTKFTCAAGYTGSVTMKCSEGTWSYYGNEKCIITPGCYEFTEKSKGKKLDISIINNVVTEVKIQLWGAKGGGTTPGLGGYSKGNFKLLPDNKALNIFVGGTPKDKTGGFNGGGTGAGSSFGGGGATDVRYGGLTLTNRIIVAGGGGGYSSWQRGKPGFSGGGLNGDSGSKTSWDGKGGGQTFNCVIPSDKNHNWPVTCGVKGVGGYGSNNAGGGGGGGWYGGSGGGPHGGGGGSGHIGEEITGGQTDKSNKPTDGGFARICWGDWTGQTNPCDSNYEESTSYTTNAGIGTNKTKCIADATNLQDVVGGTAPSCSLASFNTKMDSENVNKPSGLQNIYYEGMYIRVGCKSGYNLPIGFKPEFRATCEGNETWTVNGECEKKCDNSTPLNGYNVLAGTGQTNSGSNKEFTCASGYTGIITMECNNGNWSHSGETCKKDCTDPIDIKNGTWIPLSTNHGGTVTLSCNNGYTLSGSSTAECINGNWKYDGSCEPNPCNDNAPLNGHNVLAGTGQTNSGSEKEFACAAGYTGSVTMICNLGSWIYKIGSCNKDCTLPENPTGGTWSGSTNHGGSISLDCNTGYTKSGSKTATCTNGSWTYDGNAVCVQGACKGKPSLATGSQFHFSGGSVIGHNGSFYQNGVLVDPTSSNISNVVSTNAAILDAKCADGYKEIDHSYVCKNGIWETVGSCIQDCTITQNPSGYGWWTTNEEDKLVVNDKIPYGTTIKQVCPSGYSYGSNRRTAKCNGAGKAWTDVNIGNVCFVPGGCIGKPNLVPGGKFYPDSGNIQSEGNFYINGVKSTLNHTNINDKSFTAENNSKIDAWCDANSYTEVSDGGTCIASDNCSMPNNWSGLVYYCKNGTWKTVGSCMKNCTMPENPTGGTWSGSTNHGGSISLDCNTGSGYTKSGSKTATCTNGSWTYDGNAVCVQGACRGKPSLVAGSGIWFSEGSVYLNGIMINKVSNDSDALATNGTIFDANCASGYEEVSTNGDCVASQCGGKSGWGHYYYCQNGTWKRVGNCMKNCTMPGAPANGYWSGSTNHGNTITQICNSNSTLINTAKKYTCNNGVWNQSGDGECKKKCNYSTSVQHNCEPSRGACKVTRRCSNTCQGILEHGKSISCSCEGAWETWCAWFGDTRFYARASKTISCQDGVATYSGQSTGCGHY